MIDYNSQSKTTPEFLQLFYSLKMDNGHGTKCLVLKYGRWYKDAAIGIGSDISFVIYSVSLKPPSSRKLVWRLR